MKDFLSSKEKIDQFEIKQCKKINLESIYFKLMSIFIFISLFVYSWR